MFRFIQSILSIIIFLPLAGCQATNSTTKENPPPLQKEPPFDEKTAATKAYELHDIFAVTAIHGQELNDEHFQNGIERPFIEMNISKALATGTDGCNQYSAPFKLDNEKISFGILATTRMLCRDMTIPTHFLDAMRSVVSYKRDDLLHFYNNKGEEVLALRKVD